MEPIKVRCKSCGKEIRPIGYENQYVVVVANMTTIKGDAFYMLLIEDDGYYRQLETTIKKL